MADPLSVVSSIAGLASLGDVVFRKLYHYINSVKTAEKEVLTLRNEVAVLTGILHNLSFVAQELEDDDTLINSVRLQHVNSCLSTLYALKGRLENIDFPEKKRLRNVICKLTWPYKSMETGSLIEEIRQHRDNLNAALAADSMMALLKSLSVQEEIFGQVKDIDHLLREKQDIDTRIRMGERREKVTKFFVSAVDPNKSFQTIVKLRHPTTGFWLTENDMYIDWIQGHGPLLWLTGIPGAGKTVLSGLLIQECMNRAAYKSNRAVAYFYCDYNNEQTLRTSNILGAIAAQLARQNEESYLRLEEYYADLHPSDRLRQQPEPGELIAVLHDMADNFDDVRIVIDGLDECGVLVEDALDALKELVRDPDHNISMAILSRNEPEIRDVLNSLEHTHIEVAAQGKDIDLYVRAEIKNRIKKKNSVLSVPTSRRKSLSSL